MDVFVFYYERVDLFGAHVYTRKIDTNVDLRVCLDGSASMLFRHDHIYFVRYKKRRERARKDKKIVYMCVSEEADEKGGKKGMIFCL